ncbi:alkaline phosphatase family protein [Kitasatospora sp. GP82]|uniref:alkaline phosphatase family protein n=1 Tax=Kitasatospora sp. GP82 TaxID=3035089 RepID=UPI002475D679|nr:alkaline phosphatase family protein [Kitasatospora sp. GP82]MDH6126344.1 phospholipase C [Kitasatospora sp. GP82]
MPAGIAWYQVVGGACQAWYRLAGWACRGFAWALYCVLTAVSGVLWCAQRIRRRHSDGPAEPQGRIKHIFVLVLENRSFDHMLGVSTGSVDEDGGIRPGVGIDALTGAPTTVDGPRSQSNSHAGAVFPIRVGAPFVMPVDPPHEFCDVQLQLASTAIAGRPHDDRCAYSGEYPPLTVGGFVETYANQARVKNNAAGLADLGAVMACFTPQQVPVLSTLAREFAVCDRWFSALPGPTWPNRFFLHAATSGGLDRSPGPLEEVGSKLDGYHFENGTIYDALDAKDLPWRVYAGDALPQVSALAGMDLPTLLTHFHGLDDLADHLQYADFPAAYVFIEPSYGHVLTHGADFQCGNSQHPLDDVTRGEALIKYVYESIRRSPHWESSLLVITYDEHGGFYDHVPPPAAVPPGDVTDPENNAHGFRFDRQGVRVPAVVVSPWVPTHRMAGIDGQNCNLIDHTQYDHGSLLATVEQLYGLPALTRRDGLANTFAHLLTADAPRDAPRTLPDPAVSGFSCGEDAPGPGGPPLGGPPRAAGDAAGAAAAEAADLPLTATLRGFVQTAAIQEARLRPAEREQVGQRAGSLGTVGEAGQYLADVRGQLSGRGLRIAGPPGAPGRGEQPS